MCKPCYVKNWRETNPILYKKLHRGYRLKRKYGITIEQFDELFKEQGGLCAICFDRRATDVDHVVIDGHPVIRGLLCTACNLSIGLIKGSASLRRAAMYVEGFEH